MPSLLTTAVLAFLLGLAFTAALTAGLRHRRPRRRSETRAPARGAAGNKAPRLGGLAVLAAMGLALWGPAWLHWPMALSPGELPRQLMAPVLLVLAVGAADDIWNLAPAWKFVGQIVAALWVVGEGYRVNAVLHHPLSGGLAALVSVVWLVGCSNAFNLIDGLDGLATGLALFATGTVLAHAVLIGEPGLAIVMGALFGALAAFLAFNFPPASIYLGDAGSLSIGFLLGCMALAWANKATTAVGLLAPLFALAVPMLDTGVAILRRGLTGQPLFTGDQRHIHHRLLRRGFTPRGAVLLLYAVAGLGAAAALVLADVRQRHTFEMVILLFVLLAGVGVYQLEYVEFFGMGRLLRRGGFDPRRGLNAETTLRHWSQEIEQAPDWPGVWECLRQVGMALDFDGVEFRPAASGATGAPAAWRSAPNMAGPEDAEFCGWTCRIPLGEEGALGVIQFWRRLNLERPGFTEELASVLGVAIAARAENWPSPSARAASAGAGASLLNSPRRGGG